MNKMHIEIIWALIAGLVFTFYPYYEFRGMLEIALEDKTALGKVNYFWYLQNYTTDFVTWFIIGFAIAMILIWTVKTYFNKKKED